MQGEISDKLFQDKWIEEESVFDAETKGYDYISKMANNFAPKLSTHKRSIVSSQRIEMLIAKLKKKTEIQHSKLLV